MILRLVSRLVFSRALAAVLLANFLTLAVLNAAHAPARALLAVYPLSLVAALLLLRGAFVRRRAHRPGVVLLWSACALLVLLTVPRLSYLLEWIPGNVVLAQADDHGRLAQLIGMTLSERYPLVHPANQQFLLSHYYAPWFPMAWLKLALPPLTLKDCILAGNLLYHLLMAFSLLEIAFRLFRSPGSATVFFFLMTWFGGLDWIFRARLPFAHAEHWTAHVFGALRQVSSMYTAMYWVAHHASALMAVLLCLLLARETRCHRPWRKPLLLGLLLCSAFYSSPFVLLPLPLVAAPELLRLARRLWRTRMLAPVALLAALPLFLYFGRLVGPPFLWRPVPLPVYLALVSLVDLAGIPLFLLLSWRRLKAPERRWLAGSLAFFVSTAFIESIGYNNYCMRGMFLPTVVFFALFARCFGTLLPRARPLALAAALLFSIATLREAAWLAYGPLENSIWYWQVRGRQPPASTRPLLRPEYARLARDPSIRFYTPDARDRRGPPKYNSGKMIAGLPLAEMETFERELLRAPLRHWLW